MIYSNELLADIIMRMADDRYITLNKWSNLINNKLLLKCLFSCSLAYGYWLLKIPKWSNMGWFICLAYTVYPCHSFSIVVKWYYHLISILYYSTMLQQNHFIRFQHFTDDVSFSQNKCISRVTSSQNLKTAGKLWQEFQPLGWNAGTDIQKEIQIIPKRPIANIHWLTGDSKHKY